MAKILRLVLLSLIVALGSAGALSSQSVEKQATSSKGATGSFVLLSWKNKGGDFNFALMTPEKAKAFLKDFHPRRTGLRGLVQLKTALKELPTGASIVWEDDQVKGLTYPSIGYINQVTMFARSKGLRIELNPVVVE
jgi:hypothetical protein